MNVNIQIYVQFLTATMQLVFMEYYSEWISSNDSENVNEVCVWYSSSKASMASVKALEIVGCADKKFLCISQFFLLIAEEQW